MSDAGRIAEAWSPQSRDAAARARRGLHAGETPSNEDLIKKLERERDRVWKLHHAARLRQGESWDKAPHIHDKIGKTIAKHAARLRVLDSRIAKLKEPKE